ncbi:hypothetical protein [Nitrospirillum iridis]|uniref:Uncharacterized protein n=1 Tax=Nitrospirillum iridis TaxID=765888 RepID=A0A7X0EF30_9PROT|nr:hypothetical protein [Nitrospirillum iridis]MBB6252074.1 hypothetical protein [Nitrospirillum iridis]
MATTIPSLRVLLTLAGNYCTGPGGGALLLAQLDWLVLRLTTRALPQPRWRRTWRAPHAEVSIGN